MKQTITLMAALFVFGNTIAQDIIFTTDGQSIKARNIKFEGNVARYSLYESSIMDRMTYTIDLSAIRMIKFEDGYTYDPFNKTEADTKPTDLSSIQKPQEDKQDSAVVYAYLQPNKQLTPSLFNAYPPYKNPAVAFVYSITLSGLGQLYNDDLENGFLFMGGDILLTGLAAVCYMDEAYEGAATFLSGSIILRIVSSVAAAYRANKNNKKHGYIAISPLLRPVDLALGANDSQWVPGMAIAFSF